MGAWWRAAPLEGVRLAAGLPTPHPPTPGGEGEFSLRSAGISLAFLMGNWRVRPRMGLHASELAAFAPRAARTTGSSATTMGWPHIVVRAARFYFLGFCKSSLLKVDQRRAAFHPSPDRRLSVPDIFPLGRFRSRKRRAEEIRERTPFGRPPSKGMGQAFPSGSHKTGLLASMRLDPDGARQRPIHTHA